VKSNDRRPGADGFGVGRSKGYGVHSGGPIGRHRPNGGLCDVSVTGAWGRIDDSVTAGGLERGARGLQPSIADENTRQRRPNIIMKYIPRVFVKQDNKKCKSVVNEQKFRKLGSC